MKRISPYLLIALLWTSLTHAKELQLDDHYDLFEGKPVSLQSIIGKKPVYLKFWATWCLDCRRELPHLEQTYQKYHDKLTIYAVNLNINETDEYIRNLQEKNHLTIPILMDNNGSIAGNFDFQGTPFHVLLDAKGNVVYTTYKDDDVLEKNLEQLARNEKVAVIDNSAQIEKSSFTKTQTKGFSFVYLATTWCDWYMKDIHPEMSSNCIKATDTVNQLHRQQPNISLQSYVSHLWTDEKYLAEYKSKFSISYPVDIDLKGDIARYYQVTEYPSLLVFNNQQEIGRFTNFDKPAVILKEIEKLLKTR